jgi:hypothetical protein
MVLMDFQLLNARDYITLSVAEHFRRHARYVSVGEELDWDLLVERLSGYEAFQALE